MIGERVLGIGLVSQIKDGKGGWVNVVTGGTCASDKPGEGTPKSASLLQNVPVW